MTNCCDWREQGGAGSFAELSAEKILVLSDQGHRPRTISPCHPSSQISQYLFPQVRGSVLLGGQAICRASRVSVGAGTAREEPLRVSDQRERRRIHANDLAAGGSRVSR
jgi:hypothetical protein